MRKFSGIVLFGLALELFDIRAFNGFRAKPQARNAVIFVLTVNNLFGIYAGCLLFDNRIAGVCEFNRKCVVCNGCTREVLNGRVGEDWDQNGSDWD